MSKIIYVILFSITINLNGFSQNFQWAKGFGSTGKDYGWSISCDKYGNTYTTGEYRGTVDFDPGPSVYNLTSNGYTDVFITKIDQYGNFVWAKSIGGNSIESGFSITTDNNGYVYVTGYFVGTVDFDPGPNIYNLTSSGYFDVFIIKIDVSGNFIWAKNIGGKQKDVSTSIFVDSLMNVYTTGYFIDTADFDPGLGVFNLISPANISQSVFISKLDSSGNFIWAKGVGGLSVANRNFSNSICVNNKGSVYVSGYFWGTTDFDPGPSTYNLTSTGPYSHEDIFILKLSSSGNFVWAKKMGGYSGDYCYSMAIDKMQNIYTTGHFYDSADFNPGVNTYYLNSFAKTQDYFVSKLDSNGNFVWAKNIGGAVFADVIYGQSIYLDNYGLVYTTGCFRGTIDFDPSPSIYNLTSTWQDIYVNVLDTVGNFVWARKMGGGGVDFGYSICADSLKNVYTTGIFGSTVDFDPGPGVTNLTSNGDYDIFIHKMGPYITGNISSFSTNDINIYPNPSSKTFYIDLKKSCQNIKLNVVNSLGQTIHSINSSSCSSLTIDINGSSGIYFIEIITDDASNVFKVIKE